MNTELKHNYYEILEVPQNATQHEIAIAYEKAKRTYSPQNPALYTIFSAEEAQLFRKMLDEAFTVLGNQTYRNIYEKRMQAKSFSETELTAESIKAASTELFTEEQKKPEAPVSTDTYTIEPEFEKEIAEKTTWTGEDLKKVREYKKISVEMMQAKTKINPWYIIAIENFDVANLPAPVFVRGYLIQMARMMGLKDLLVADSYMHSFRKKIEN
jgi:DnaJ-class molecular chaperone